jgi:hypothetical protein
MSIYSYYSYCCPQCQWATAEHRFDILARAAAAIHGWRRHGHRFAGFSWYQKVVGTLCWILRR